MPPASASSSRGSVQATHDTEPRAASERILVLLAIPTFAEDLTLRIPPVKNSVAIDNPAVVEKVASVQNMRFARDDSGSLLLELEGEVHLSASRVRELID